MIQLIAVHVVDSLPLVMELDTDGLNFVQRHALQSMPRSPSGVPELRGLAAADGPLQFKFKIPPEKVTPAGLLELLAMWDSKFSEATLKQIAKRTKSERDAATAAGLWKEGVEKGDLNAMHQNCSPGEAQVFHEALAIETEKAKTKSKAQKAARTNTKAPKPKLLAAVVDATTTLDPLTGKRIQHLNASEKAVTSLDAQAMVATVLASITSNANLAAPVEFGDPLETAKQAMLLSTPCGEDSDNFYSEGATHQINSVNHTNQTLPQDGGAAAISTALLVKNSQTANAGKKVKAPRLVEMTAQDLFRHLKGGSPGVFADQGGKDDIPEDGHLAQSDDQTDHKSGQSDPRDFGDAQEFGGHDIPMFYPFLEFEPPGVLAAGAGAVIDMRIGQASTTKSSLQPAGEGASVNLVAVQQVLQSADWSTLVSFRLDNHRNEACAVLLASGEVFEALGYLQIGEPLAIKVEWLLDAVGQGDMLTSDVQALREATDWLRAELDWRGQELVRWMGKTDLVSLQMEEVQAGSAAEKATRITNTKKRPAGWVASGCKLASLAQSITLDIAMLDLTTRNIERGLEGMPAWAIDAMDNLRSFALAEVSRTPAVARSAAGAVFRDVWREELQRIDRWCSAFSNIKIARQIGLFGASADLQLLQRLEQIIDRTRAWRAAPAQASRVLAVWVAFVLSLDHDNRPAALVAGRADRAWHAGLSRSHESQPCA
jgi:hypothetical protein